MPRKRKVYDGADPEAAEAAGKRHRAELERQRRLDFTEEAKRHRAEAERLRRLGFTEEDKRREAERKRLKRLEKRTLGQRVTRTEEQKAKHAERMRLSRLNKKLSGQRVQRTEEQKAKEARRKWAARHRADPGPSTSAAVMPLLQGQWTQAVGGAQHHVAKALPHMSSVVRQVCAEDPAVDAHPVRLKQEITEEPCQSTSQAVYQEFVEEPDVDISHLVKQELIEESDMNTGNVAKQEFTEEVDMDISQVVKKELLEEPHLDFTHSVKQECIEDSEEVITGLPYDECELSSVKSHTSPGLPVEPAYNVRPQSTVFPSSLHWSHGVQTSPALVAWPIAELWTKQET